MPRKVFADLNILTAQDLNDNLMDQSVQTFADSGTRDSQIPVGQRRAGMMAFTANDQMWWQYIVVSTVGYWAPQVGSTVLSVYSTAATALPAATLTPIAMTGIVKNLNTWWASNRFTPKVPGYYTFSGGISFEAGASAFLYRISTLAKNGTSLQGSGNEMGGLTGYQHTVPIRTTSTYMNGTTDYIELMGQQQQSTPATINTVPGSINLSPSLIAVYSGM